MAKLENDISQFTEATRKDYATKELGTAKDAWRRTTLKNVKRTWPTL